MLESCAQAGHHEEVTSKNVTSNGNFYIYAPTFRRVFSGVEGWGCIKSGPPKNRGQGPGSALAGPSRLAMSAHFFYVTQNQLDKPPFLIFRFFQFRLFRFFRLHFVVFVLRFAVCPGLIPTFRISMD